jgi:hypothetical protein
MRIFCPDASQRSEFVNNFGDDLHGQNVRAGSLQFQGVKIMGSEIKIIIEGGGDLMEADTEAYFDMTKKMENQVKAAFPQVRGCRTEAWGYPGRYAKVQQQKGLGQSYKDMIRSIVTEEITVQILKALPALGTDPADKIRKLYDTDTAFKERVNRYLEPRATASTGGGLIMAKEKMATIKVPARLVAILKDVCEALDDDFNEESQDWIKEIVRADLEQLPPKERIRIVEKHHAEDLYPIPQWLRDKAAAIPRKLGGEQDQLLKKALIEVLKEPEVRARIQSGIASPAGA